MSGKSREQGEEIITNAPCPMPNTSLREAAPTTSLRDATRTLSTSAQCPMPNLNVRLSVAKDSRRQIMI
ncbi:MAG: hypothetical protein ACYTXY_16755 [Nostoc sp.]